MTYLEPVQPALVITAAGSAIVTAVKIGRTFSRAGWGLARRLPGGQLLERELQRVQQAAIGELRRALDVAGDPNHPGLSADERRSLFMIHSIEPGREPLRGAMSELLERSVKIDRSSSREFLYGNIISQLVPDEARIIAALADGSAHAVVDVTAKRFRSRGRTVLANASAVGRAAGVITIDAVPTYVTRLQGFGLVELGPEDDRLSTQYEILATESAVRAAEASIAERGLGTPHLVRKTVTISSFGRELWAASDPSHPASPRGAS